MYTTPEKMTSLGGSFHEFPAKFRDDSLVSLHSDGGSASSLLYCERHTKTETCGDHIDPGLALPGLVMRRVHARPTHLQCHLLQRLTLAELGR